MDASAQSNQRFLGVREGEAEPRGGLTDLAHVEVAGAVGVKLLEKRREVLEGSLFLTTVLSRHAAHSYTESALSLIHI